MSCAVCGEALPENARFCPNCGAGVAVALGTEERKMVTVLFADLVDSTGLTRKLDAERAREVLGQFFHAATEELQKLRGRPEKFIGDAVMAVFGLPTVGEDDALRAVRAGLAIRGRIQRLSATVGLSEPLEIRVGIESGEAATGIGPLGQLLVTGTVVNAAARLQTAAEPDQVLVGETTFALTESAVSFADRVAVSAKGFDKEIGGFPVLGLTTRSARRTIPFVGRNSELSILRESMARAAGSGRPVLVTVLGEPGIGKSRLADELVAALGDDALAITGLTGTYADTATFAPVASMVGELSGISMVDPPDRAKERLRELVKECEDVERTVERLALLFGMAEHRNEPAFVHDVHAGFLALIDGLSRERPILLVFEDAHLLKGPMLDLIEHLGRPAHDRPRRVMALALARSELLDERPGWGSRAENAVALRLDPLSPDESVELVRQAGGGRIGEGEAAEVAARAGGNPFFIVETTGMLLSGEGGTTRAGASIPPTVHAIVSARLDALPPRLREITRKASTFLVSFDERELAAVDSGATAADLELLEAEEIIVREGPGRTVRRWRFRHSTVKEVAYASLPKRERLRLHQLVADRLSEQGHPTWAAEHLELAAVAAIDVDPGDRSIPERAADALLRAGDRARRRMEGRSAIDYYDRALALGGPDEGWGTREARALAGTGEARYWLGEYPAAREALERAAELGTRTEDLFTLALAFRFLGDIAINVEADLDKAEALLDRSLEAAEALDEPMAIVRTLLFAGWVPWTRDQHDEAEAIWQRAVAVAEPDDGWARVRALNSLSVNITTRPMDDPRRPEHLEEGLALSDEASALAEEIGDQFSIAMTTVQRARVLEDLGRLDEALAGMDRGIAIFEDLGSRWEYADALAERGVVKRELGQLDGAEDDLKKAIRISEELGERQLGSWIWRALARVAERRGDQAKAEEYARHAREAEERFMGQPSA